jgi:hypothetical protein
MARTQIKRKYGEYANIRVNEKAPVRNKVVQFVGKRFVTEEEMKQFLTKLTEERGKDLDANKWFGRNGRYFEKFENRGQKVLTLSKYGKRVLEMIRKSESKTNLNESSNIGLFKSEIFESVKPEVVYEFEWSEEEIAEAEKALNEAALAKKGARELADINLGDQIDNAEDKEMAEYYEDITKALGESDPRNVIQVDSETHDEDPLMNKIYNYLSTNFSGTEDVKTRGNFGSGMGQATVIDPALNVVRIDDYGFVAFYFTANSKF